jgi:hypothetical protein
VLDSRLRPEGSTLGVRGNDGSDQAAEIQPDGQTSTHIGDSLWPSHSVQVAASILKKILPELIALVGQTGLQSPQAVHMSGSIFIAMMLSFISAFAG